MTNSLNKRDFGLSEKLTVPGPTNTANENRAALKKMSEELELAMKAQYKRNITLRLHSNAVEQQPVSNMRFGVR